MGTYMAKLFKNTDRQTRILIQGLDAAGKTTVLYRLKLGEVVTTIPTIGFNVETIEYKRVAITAWDVGGRDKIRPLWRHYYQNTDGLVYVVDSADHERLEQARDELMATLAEDELKDVFVAVMANKQDLPKAYSFTKIAEELRLHSLKEHKWCIFPTTATKGEGLFEALDWIAAHIKWSRTKKAATEPVVQSVQDVQKAVQEISKVKTTGWNHVLHAWKSIFSWSQT